LCAALTQSGQLESGGSQGPLVWHLSWQAMSQISGLPLGLSAAPEIQGEISPRIECSNPRSWIGFSPNSSDPRFLDRLLEAFTDEGLNCFSAIALKFASIFHLPKNAAYNVRQRFPGY
jgi:hypothetical protein